MNSELPKSVQDCEADCEARLKAQFARTLEIDTATLQKVYDAHEKEIAALKEEAAEREGLIRQLVDRMSLRDKENATLRRLLFPDQPEYGT